MWLVQAEREEAALQRLLAEELRTVTALVEREIGGIQNAVARQAARWNALNGTPREVWDVDASGNFDSYLGVISLAWIDDQGRARWIFENNRTADVDLDLNGSPEMAEALRRARETDDIAVSAPFRSLRDGVMAISIFKPVFTSGDFDGYIGVRVSLEALLTGIARRAGVDVTLSLTDGDGRLLVGDASTPANDEGTRAVRAFAVGATALNMTASPTPRFIQRNDPGFADATLILGLSATLVCVAFAVMASRIRRQNRQLMATRDQIAVNDRRYRELFTRGELGFVVCDPRSVIIDCNDAYARMAGRSESAALIGRRVADLLHPEDSQRLLSGLASLDRVDGTHNSQWRYLRPDGTEIVALVNTIKEDTVDGPRLICIVNDITEHRKAERRAAAATSIYGSLFDSTDIAIYDDDLSGLFPYFDELRAAGIVDLRAHGAKNPDVVLECARRVKLNNMNAAAMKMFGVRSYSEFSRDDYFLLGERPKHIFNIACAMWNGEARYHTEGAYTRIDGVEIPIAYNLRIPKTIDEARSVPFLVLDLTDIRAAANAREATAAKSRFLASMSHEIRTPLNGIIANLELLAQTDLGPGQVELLDDADKAAKSLMALIGNILDFSKIEAGKLAIEMGDVEIESLLQQVVDILQSKARQKGLFVTFSIGADVPEVVRGDAARLRQILLNLVGNSIKFTHRGGIHLAVDAKDWDGAVCLLEFAVHDSGVGFQPSETAKLFESFAQAQNTRAGTHEEGTGLGLSICRSLVETFGGEISAEGVPGEGATFRFSLPAECIRRASTTRRADLTGRAVALVGDTEFLTSPIAKYFVERHAAVTHFKDLNAVLDACVSADAEGRHFDIAVIAALSGDPARDRESLRILRQHRTVPLVVGDDRRAAVWRKTLGIGGACIVSEAGAKARFDRNMAALVGAWPGVALQTAERQDRNVALPDFNGAHVLVLEDRLVNQTVIQRQLKRLNVKCTMASDGFQGLQRLKAQKFALVLADCSMPNMDGFEFTRQLRRQEALAADGRRLPIIALTANAFREDAEKCFAAGMDDFLSKPVTLDRLGTALERWLKPETVTAVIAAPPQKAKTAPESAPIDMAALADLLGTADTGVLAEVLREFAAAARASFDEVAMSVARDDLPGIMAAAHGAKGEARNAAAVRLGDLYADLEAKARTKDPAALPVVLSDIRAEVARVESFIATLAERAA
ncbi:MAG: ATP-binding protein [Rhodospirillaceae bacterium]|nr:ATP-binding protein [Rhodospirillaceae bacterium]